MCFLVLLSWPGVITKRSVWLLCGIQRSSLDAKLAYSFSAGHLFSPFCSDFLILSTSSEKLEDWKLTWELYYYYYLFNRKEKLTTIQKRKLKWPNKFSVLYFGFLVCATTSSSWSPPGSQEHFKLLLANNWKQRKKSLYVVGATTLPPLNHMTCVFMAPLTLDMQTSIPWPVSTSYYSWGWAAHHTTKPGGTVNTLEIFHTLPGKLSFLLLFSPYWIHEPICSKQMSIGHIGQ